MPDLFENVVDLVKAAPTSPFSYQVFVKGVCSVPAVFRVHHGGGGAGAHFVRTVWGDQSGETKTKICKLLPPASPVLEAKDVLSLRHRLEGECFERMPGRWSLGRLVHDADGALTKYCLFCRFEMECQETKSLLGKIGEPNQARSKEIACKSEKGVVVVTRTSTVWLIEGVGVTLITSLVFH